MVGRVVANVARAFFLLQTADPVYEARGAGSHPGPGEGLGVSVIGTKALGVCPEGDGNLRQLIQRGDPPRLCPIGDVAVGEQDDGRHVGGGQTDGLHGHIKTIHGRGGGNDRERGLAVTPVEGLKEIGLFGLGGQASRGASPLDVDGHQRQLHHNRQPDGFGLQRHSGPAGPRDPQCP